MPNEPRQPTTNGFEPLSTLLPNHAPPPDSPSDTTHTALSSSASLSLTDLPPSGGGMVSQRDVSQRERGWGEGGSERSTEEEEENQPATGSRKMLVDGVYPAMTQCGLCGAVEHPHNCPKATLYDIPVPDELEELIVYLHQVWDIRFAELVALECGSVAIRWAVQIVKRGRAGGEAYVHPAGLIVNLARRLARASRRRR